jgi:membrane associated rhomboid family serine protease
LLRAALLAADCRAAYVTTMDQQAGQLRARHEPIFNVPTVVVAILAVLAFVHVVREWAMTEEQNIQLLLWFSFIPARFDSAVIAQGDVPGGIAADIWTFVTYALLHGDWTHLGLNGVWLLAFGTPVARRFGAIRFLAFFACTAAAGAAMHLLTHLDAFVPMIGASASISGFMAASMRFVFQRSGPLGMLRNDDEAAYRVPALPLTAVFRNGPILVFLFVWFALNLLFGIGSVSLNGSDQAIAWQAHVGGFLAGLFGFALFDPIKSAPPGDRAGGNHQTTVH